METWKEEIAALLKETTNGEMFEEGFLDFGRERQPETIAVILKNGRDEIEKFVTAVDTLNNVRERLPKGFVAYVGTTDWLSKKVNHGNGIELAVGKGSSQFDILRLAKTDACNYDLSTEDLIKPLVDFDKRFGIDIFHAESDKVSLVFNSLPSDMESFAKELFDYCEDLSQLDLDEESLAEMLSADRTIGFWWD